MACFSTLASRWRSSAASAAQGATNMPRKVKVMKPSRRLVCQNGAAPAAVLNQKATKKASGTATPTATTCSTQRGSQAGRRRGHCSNSPKTSISAMPTPNTRVTSFHSGASQPKLNSRVKSAQTMPTVRTRRQPSRARQPAGEWAALSWAAGFELMRQRTGFSGVIGRNGLQRQRSAGWRK